MSLKSPTRIAIAAAGLVMFSGCSSPSNRSMTAVGSKSASATPCMDVLYRAECAQARPSGN